MRALTIAIIAMALCAGLAIAGETGEATIDDLVREVRELRHQVEELRARVEKLQARPAEGSEEPWLPEDEGWERRGPDLQALRKIQLPHEPTRDEVREYVKRIVAVSARQNFASSTDPQVSMLRRVGSENLDILLDAHRHAWRSMARTYITYAIKGLAKREHKEEILDYLPLEPELVSVVLRYGWAADARDVLLSELTAPGKYIPQEWLQAVAGLGDAEALDSLKTYFVEGRNRDNIFEVLRMTPGIGDLDGLVAQAWERAKAQGGDEALDTAQVAVGYGHEDALALLMRFLAAGHDPRGSAPFVRRSLLLHTEARGTSEQLVQWYQQNKDRLRWDRDTDKFRVRAEEPPPADAEAEGTQ